MKQCPVCTATFPDQGEFCLNDGTPLIPIPGDLAPTVPPAADSEPNETLVAGSMATGESRSTGSLPPRQTGNLESNSIALALSMGDSSLIGHVLAERYRIEAIIGRGGMGVVYRARQELLDRQVAVKLLRPQFLANEVARQRFLREARAMARIEHPNAITIYDFGTLPDGAAFLVMECIAGESLRSLLARIGPLPPSDAAALGVQICDAVATAHRREIIHRDLKPENILLKRTEEGVVVKVADFGLAKFRDGAAAGGKAFMTSAGELFGTPAYMAPEHFEGETVDARTDVYAIGIMLYEMLTGTPPFKGTIQTIMSGHLFREPSPLPSEGIPPALDEIVRAALEKDPEKRIGSAVELATRLRGALDVIEVEPEQLITTAIQPVVLGATSGELTATADTAAGRIETSTDEMETHGRPIATSTLPTVETEVPKSASPASRRFVVIAAAASILVFAFAALGLTSLTATDPMPQPLEEPSVQPAPKGEAVPPTSPVADPPRAVPPVSEQAVAPTNTDQPPEAPEPPVTEPEPPRRPARSAEPNTSRGAAATEGDRKQSEEAKKKGDDEKKRADEKKKKKKRKWYNPFSW